MNELLDQRQPAPGVSPATDRQDSGVQHRLAELLVAVSNGDRDAFTAFYRMTDQRVFGLALWMTRNAAMAEEVAQEVYLQVWSLAGRYNPGMSTPIGWVLMLTHRRVVDRIRSEQAASGRESVYGAVHRGRDHDVVFETVEQRHDERAVQRCLTLLTPLQRECIVLAYYGGLTYPQVAARLGAPVPTVKSRVREGFKRMAGALNGSVCP
ncbi:sigma-70 family RNA polymerase sigma factor [Nocardia spumae]|uniref:sigma-70 family RNA polymerase sigma factor n=1 Tax=Nocardia spumae TaxID=2887190 RepID=UPI001D15092D|nr:sigma-70 family RNA polymerase sigma factor [Nocardia spumae]